MNKRTRSEGSNKTASSAARLYSYEGREAEAKIAPSPVAAIKIKMNTARLGREDGEEKSINFVDLNFSPGATVSLTKKRLLSDTDTDAHSEIHHAVEVFLKNRRTVQLLNRVSSKQKKQNRGKRKREKANFMHKHFKSKAFPLKASKAPQLARFRGSDANMHKLS